jgi:putative ABC transport system permease protein
MRIIHNLKESFLTAYAFLKINKLRTFLTLFGITIGIFAIISVFTLIDSLDRTIRESLSSLGDDIVYVEKWPWTPPPGEEYAWWKYLKRPVPDYEEYEYLRRNLTSAKAIAFSVRTRKTVSFRDISLKNTTITAYTKSFEEIRSLSLIQGRYFSSIESQTGKNLAVLGHEIAQELFHGASPLNKEIKIAGRKVTVIGVLKKEGNTAMTGAGSMDKTVILPLHFAKRFININHENVSPNIIIRSRPEAGLLILKSEIRRFLRAKRMLKPVEEDNFAINQATMITNRLDQIFGVINTAGWLIGGFSILVGGFGIANIMFVSVKERTNIIGIQKALGAKNYFILSQFLFEAVILAIIGGAIGLFLIFIGTIIGSQMTELKIALSLGNIFSGLLISSVIGIISGFAPARTAARLNPVEAINATF